MSLTGILLSTLGTPHVIPEPEPETPDTGVPVVISEAPALANIPVTAAAYARRVLGRDDTFLHVNVDYSLRGGDTRITWDLSPTFCESLPHTFQLQANLEGGDPSLWCDVGEPVDNSFYQTISDDSACKIVYDRYAADDGVRQCGKTLRIVYRVVLTTGEAIHESPASQVLGLLSRHQWLQARAIIRKQLLEHSSLHQLPGLLMKRKIHGTVCTECVDPHTNGITDSNCPECFGTGKIDGYWAAAEDNMIDMDPDTYYSEVRGSRATINDIIVKGTFIGLPQLNSRDVWIDSHSDKRFIVHKIRNLVELNQVPLLVQVELRMAEFTHPVYDIDPEQGN